MDQLKENETNRGIEFYFKETFTATYFKQFQSIKSTTIEALVSNGYEDKNSLLALDLIHDLPLIQSINLAQKSLLRKALEKLKCEELGEHEMNNKRNRRSFDQNNANSKMIKTSNSDRKIATKKESLESWYSFEALDSKHEEIERSTQLAESKSHSMYYRLIQCLNLCTIICLMCCKFLSLFNKLFFSKKSRLSQLNEKFS
jgi:hypothetical protein